MSGGGSSASPAPPADINAPVDGDDNYHSLLSIDDEYEHEQASLVSDAAMSSASPYALEETDILVTRWAFLAPFLKTWLEFSEYEDRVAVASSPDSSLSPQFDAFRVFLPWSNGPPQAQQTLLRQLLDATQLVAAMFHLDKSTWWFVKKEFKPWFHLFEPSSYDQTTLVPKMRFVLHRRFSHQDDKLDAVRLLYQALCGDNDRTEEDINARAFRQAKAELLQRHDPENELSGFQIPISFEFMPEAPSSPEHLKAYLQDVIVLVQAINCRANSPDSSYAFRLEDIQLKLRMHHLNGVQNELRRLLSLGVPVNIQLRQVGESYGMSCSVDDCTNSSNVYSALARDPASRPEDDESDVHHTLDHRMIYSSPEFWSALAFAPNIEELAIHQQFLPDREDRTTHAKWLSYALSRTRVRRLSLTMFEPTEEELDTIRDVAQAPDPTRLMGISSGSPKMATDGAQVVSLRHDAMIQIPNEDVRTLLQLSIPVNWRFPIVDVNEEDGRVAFIVPGYGICSTSLSGIDTLEAAPPTLTHSADHDGLRSLAIYSDEQRPGVASRFVELFGRSLRTFRWVGDDHVDLGEASPFDDDLAGVLASCPQLETVVLKERTLKSLASLMLHSETYQGSLRSLTLHNVSIPSAELVKFFNHLADPRNQLARRLCHFSYQSADDAMDDKAIDAALAMLRTNRALASVDIGLSEELWEIYEQRFHGERGVQVKVDRLPLRAKLSFLSVIPAHEDAANSALSRIDSSCVSVIFAFFGRFTVRQITIRSI